MIEELSKTKLALDILKIPQRLTQIENKQIWTVNHGGDGGILVETDPVWTADKLNYLTSASASSTYIPYTGATTNVDLGIHTLTGSQLTSTVATGTAPLVVTSTTPVTNLSIGGNAATVTNGVYTNAANSMSLINPLTTLAESWIGPSSTTGVYFKGGNIGIGTTNPIRLLDVAGSIRIGSGINGGLIDFGGGAGGVGNNFILYTGTTLNNGNLDFAVGGVDSRMVIQGSSGNVGIGTTAPLRRLDINEASGNCLRLIYNDSDGSAANYADFLVSSGGDLTIAPSGADTSVTGRFASTNTAVTVANGATTFAVASNVVTVTGDAGGNTVATITGGLAGQVLTLIFVDALVTITDTAAATANTVNLSAAFTSAANTTLTLVFTGTKWLETARSVNG